MPLSPGTRLGAYEIVAPLIADRYGLLPPDDQGLFGVGESLTYATQRILTRHHSLAREVRRSEISRVAPDLGAPPVIEEYRRLASEHFADWRLTIDGLVSRPSSFSLADLRTFPVHRQITHQACEEGWSFIAEWIGVQLSYVLDLVGTLPQAQY